MEHCAWRSLSVLAALVAATFELAEAKPWREHLIPSFEADHAGLDGGWLAPGAQSLQFASEVLQGLQNESGITEELLSSLPHLPKSRDLMLKMHDGVRLFTRVVLPHPYDAKKPTCLVRSPYGSHFTQNLGLVFMLLNGHAVVMQEVRGTWRSEGVYDMQRHEGRDAQATMAWVTGQRWSDGDVYVMGASADGLAAISSDFTAPRQVHGQWIIWASGNGHQFIYPGGAFREDLAVAYMGTLKLATRGAATEQVLPALERHEAFGEWWYDYTACADWLEPDEAPGCRYDRIKWPMVYTAGWWDIFHATAFDEWFGLQAVGDPAYKKDHVLIVAPLGHNIIGKLYTGLRESMRLRKAEAQGLLVGTKLVSEFWTWSPCARHRKSCRCRGRVRFGKGDRWSSPKAVQGSVMCSRRKFQNPPRGIPRAECQCQEATGPLRKRIGRVNLFVMASFGVEDYRGPGNYWCSLPDFPATRPKRLYLAQGGRLRRAPASRAGNASYSYDPADPAPNVGGDNLPHISTVKGGQYAGTADQSARERRSDVLVFDSPRLEQDLPVVGAFKARLFVSSSAPDTDFFLTVDDYHPGGKSMLVRYGMRRMRWRGNWTERAAPMEPGRLYEVTFDLGYMAYIFPKGNIVRLSVSSAAAPYYNPTSNTGANDMVTKAEKIVARNAVHFGPAQRAYLELPRVSLSEIPENPRFTEGGPFAEGPSSTAGAPVSVFV